MASFSNGTQGMAYVSHYCEQCVNYRDIDDGRGPGCPVWDVHLMFAYGAKDDLKVTLDTLIPMEGLFAGECAMFLKPSEV